MLIQARSRLPKRRGLVISGLVAASVWALAVPATAATPTPSPTPTVTTPWLPFDLPADVRTGVGTRKVFALYFPTFSRVIRGTADERTDYYTDVHLSPRGEMDRYIAGGGYLRDRPWHFPSTAISGTNNPSYEDRVAAVRTEVRQAIAAGLDGWYLDVLKFAGDLTSPSLWQRDNVVGTTYAVLDAVADVNRLDNQQFRLILMPDLFSRGAMTSRTPQSMAHGLLSLVNSNTTVSPDGAARDRRSTLMTVPDGVGGQRVVLMPAGDPDLSGWTSSNPPAAGQGAGYWTSVHTSLAAAGLPVSLMPMFLSANLAKAQPYFPISFGISAWGNRNAVDNAAANQSTLPDLVNAIRSSDGELWSGPGVKRRLIWAQPVSIQDNRPKGVIGSKAEPSYREALATENLRNSWALANTFGDWAQLPTWNDYSEASQFAPTARSGWGWLDLNAWYLTSFKRSQVGSATPPAMPAITRDTVFVAHRQHVMSATPVLPMKPFVLEAGALAVPKDALDVVVFVKQAGKIDVLIGSTTVVSGAAVAAGTPTVVTATAQVGAIKVRFTPNGSTTPSLTLDSPFPVVARPYVLDPTYVIAHNRTSAHTDSDRPATDTTPPVIGTGAKLLRPTSGTVAKLKWPAPTDNSVTGAPFVIVRKRLGSGAWSDVAAVPGQYWTDPAWSSTASYQVVPYDRAGNAGTPSAVSTTTVASEVADTTPPSVVGGLRVDPPVSPLPAAGTPAKVSWGSSVDDDRVAQYRIYRGTTPTYSSTTWTVVQTVAAPTGIPGPLSWTDTAPLPGTSYYMVTAVDASGNARSTTATPANPVGESKRP